MAVVRILNMFTIMNRGGAETMVMNYYRNIDRTKVQFDFLVHRQERGAYDDEIEALGGRIYRMIPIYPQNFGKYKKMLKDFFSTHKEYKIIHSHMSELGYFAFKEAKRHGLPVRICHAHNAPHGWDLKMVMRTYFKHAMMPYITHMFMCGEESGEWLFGKKNKDKFIQLNNAIDAQKFIYNPEIAKKLRKELGIEDKFVIGHVGRFNEQKNHERLIAIFNEIQKINRDSVLLLLGNGYLEEKCKNIVNDLNLNDKVKFLGIKSNINEYLQSFDIFLFPSLFEGLPVTMVEAQAAGLHCFISDVIPKQCIITNNVDIISLNDSNEKIATEIIEKHTSFKRVGMYDVIKEKGFDIKNNAKELEGFYRNVYK